MKNSNMLFSDVTADYINHIKFEQGLAKTTCTCYSSGLRRYQRYLAAEGHPKATVDTALAVPMLRKFQYSLAKQGLQPRSVHGAFDPLQGLCAFLVNQGLLDENPTLKLTMPKKGSANRETACDQEVEALFDACGRMPTDWEAARARCIVALLCYTGMRVSELAAVQVGHVNLNGEPPMITVVHGKGSKSRPLYLSPEALEPLKAWLAERKKANCAIPALIASTPGRNVSDEWLRQELERIKAAANLRGHDNIKPHTLRHWFATNMLRNGATIKQVQVALGHTDIKTTAVYLHIDEEDAKAMADLSYLRSNRAAATDSNAASSPSQSNTDAAANKKGVAERFMQRRRTPRRAA
jgi:site-specific recombinase XerD